MRLCPECKSDSIERTSSMAARVIICLILIFFIPFGIFVAWVPFVFAHTYRCNVCGSEGKEEQLVEMDWRERELLLEEHKGLEGSLAPLLGKWFATEGERLFKITKGKGQLLVVEFSPGNMTAMRIHEYVEGVDYSRLVVKENLSSEFNLIKEEENEVYSSFDLKGENINSYRDIKLSAFGQSVVREDEFSELRERDFNNMLDWLRQQDRLLKGITIEISKG
ncbi:MAG: hypothetical protein SCK28_11180 [Bacillota bacterium]|nr:hypothetical protein [Bacillota bacterium]